MSPRLTVRRRTFEANEHPKGSPERQRLNERPLTSEYMPSYRYLVLDSEHPRKSYSFRTKREAEAFLHGHKLT